MAKHFQVDTDGTLTTDLVSYWPFEGNSNDFYGSDNGSDTAMAYGLGYGKVNEGADFNGSSSLIGLGNPVSSGNYFSWAGWVYVTSVPGSTLDGMMFSSTTWNSNGQMIVHIRGSGSSQFYFMLEIYDGSADTVSSAATNYVANTWYHLAVTYDASSNKICKLYVNGVLSNSHSMSAPPVVNTTTSQMGEFAASGRWFGGYLDEVGIWSKALVQQEVTDLYNGGSGQTMVSSTTYTKAASVTMMNAASRYASATYHHVINWVRSASVTMMNSASRLATATYHLAINWTRTASVSMMNSASRYATAAWSESLVFVRAASVSIMNSASRFAKSTKQFIIKIGNTIRWDFWTFD